MRVRFGNTFTSRFLFVAALLLISATTSSAARLETPPSTTLAIFSDRPMADGLWLELVTALREELASGSPEMQPLFDYTTVFGPGAPESFDVQIIPGESISRGLVVGRSIVVFLHGDCVTDLSPQPDPLGKTWSGAALGWVRTDNGHIEPFIHVDCKRIGQMLRWQGMGRNRDQRNKLMAVAIARVIMHEWIHIATQSAHHSQHGVFKSEFGVTDLLAQTAKPAFKRGTR
jgi:hypothetical protein